ncbi:dephospho-CoA kinase [Pseudoalteromonas porphyrae]|uniref:dephospho-CoA kinase n=1 Tax=Pseudoalteromonas porphyrae TaxID=187330 RepID=UPI0006BAB048|nr:dephospho-CoA kinase [Pseudoalteromonas porphyrae]KPH96607.1 dephospho-CoA kinase [Pseudoalteromonas porphyrae]
MARSKNNWILGLTGGIGCGKSAVSELFEQHGITVVDADIIARQVVAHDSTGLHEIGKHFGADILNHDGTLNRTKLREIIFADSEQKNWLNALLHPLIREKTISDLNAASSPYVILTAPLLFENQLDKYCNRTLVIDVPIEVQVARTIARDNISLAQANSIIAAQMSREDKQAKATDILDNNRALSLVAQDVTLLHQRYMALANESKI